MVNRRPVHRRIFRPASPPAVEPEAAMPLTALDPRSALLVIDLQKGIVGMETAHPAAGVVANAAALAAAFRRRGLPVVLVTVSGAPPGRTEVSSNVADLPAGWDELVPELAPHPTDHRVVKRTWGAFTNTDLDPYLKNRGVTQVVIAGIATSLGVESTARHARELGFNVALATDAMTDRSAAAHENSVARIFPRLGETGTTAEVIARLEGRA